MNALNVIPAKANQRRSLAGIQYFQILWTPAFAGVAVRNDEVFLKSTGSDRDVLKVDFPFMVRYRTMNGRKMFDFTRAISTALLGRGDALKFFGRLEKGTFIARPNRFTIPNVICGCQPD